MKIAYLCNFTYPMKEGVWNRVYSVSKEMIKRGHEIHVFSSNLSSKVPYEVFEGIHIHRFPVKYKIGVYSMFFDFRKELIKYNPDVIGTEGYRTLYSHEALKLAKKLNKPCFLTTHAPFNRERSAMLSLGVKFYDSFFGRSVLNSYTKVITISKWETLYLLKAGCKLDSILCVPNGIPNEFLKLKLRNKITRTVCFFGRISDIKNVNLLIDVAKDLPDVRFKILGPVVESYELVEPSENVEITDKTYDRVDQIKLINQSDIFVLPSKSEGIPQSIIEAMAAGLVVIGSNIPAIREVIGKERGFIFKDKEGLKRQIKYVIDNYSKLKSMRELAQKYARNLGWSSAADQLEKLYLESINTVKI